MSIGFISLAGSVRLGCIIFFFGCLVPLLCDIFLPVVVLLNFLDSILNDCQCLPYLVVLHVLFIIKIVCKFYEVFNFFVSLVVLLLFGSCPRRFLLSFGLSRRF